MTPIEQGFDEAVWSEGNPPWWGFHRGVKRSDNAGYVNMGAFAWSPGPEGFPYDTGGITNDPKLVRRLKGQGWRRGRYRNFVFSRMNAPCHLCDQTIRKQLMAGRRLYWCPGCQPAP